MPLSVWTASYDASGPSAWSRATSRSPLSAASATLRRRSTFSGPSPGVSSGRSSEPIGLGKRGELLTRAGEPGAVLLGDRVAHLGGLRRRSAGRDDRPCRRLVGGVEQHRTLTRVRPLQRADHRVTLADAEELLAVMVERQDPGHLGDHRAGVRPAAGAISTWTGASGSGWRNVAAACPTPPSTAKARRISPVKRRGTALGGAEPELSRRLETEGSARSQRVHVSPLTPPAAVLTPRPQPLARPRDHHYSSDPVTPWMVSIP